MKASYNRETSYTGLTSAMESPGNSPIDAQKEFVEFRLENDRKRRKPRRCTFIVLALLGSAVVMFVAGFLAAHLTKKPIMCHKEEGEISSQQSVKDALLQSIKTETLEEFLRFYSLKPHLAGSQRSEELAYDIRDKWLSYGFDEVELPEYDVLLSLPDRNKPDKVEIRNTIDGTTVVSIDGTTLASDGTKEETLPFLGYTGTGNVTGDLVYVNYGRKQDFDMLVKRNIECQNKILIMRFGRNFQGFMVQMAEKCGAKGALFYPDPAEYAPDGEKTYPATWWLPKTGTVMGTLLDDEGDPLTPRFPSVKGIHRVTINDTKLPRIPAYTISYEAAEKLLSRMRGPEVDNDWKGALNITYRFGPGFNDHNLIVRLEVNTQPIRKQVYNVIGTIYGREEPDRVVLLGSHRDAWNYGGMDPSSGIAVMMEISRILSKVLKQGWRPRRTIIFCNWAAEELALIGSYEWVEENADILATRAVAYLNLDPPVSGNYTLRVSGSPLLQSLVFSETKLVTDPNGINRDDSMYKLWKDRAPSEGEKDLPSYFILGAGSDYAAFYQYLGIPSLDLTYATRSGYPLYHTNCDTFEAMKTFLDPKFKFHLAMTKLITGIMLNITENPLLMFRFEHFNKLLENGLSQFKKRNQSDLNEHGIFLDELGSAIKNLQIATGNFSKYNFNKDGSSKLNFQQMRTLNDQMMQFERVFITPEGLPNKRSFRHVLFGPQLLMWMEDRVFLG